MIRILLTIALISAFPAMASDWSSLWRNADQRGDLLLQQGNAAAAAKVYSNPQRKAYAEMLSNDYKSAAGQLAAVDEGDAPYNRGVALAHTGDLHGAIHAFDAALKLDPKNKDARHNKALVAKALKQNQKKPQDKKSSSDSKKNKNKKDKQKNQGNKENKENKGNKNNKDNKDKQGNPSDHTNKKQDSTPSKPEKKSDQDNTGKSSDPTQAKPAANSNDASKAAKEAAQAKLDALSSLAKSGKLDHPLASKPPSEKQLAQAQWLRSIPDNPSGLLRRKFLIEYMIRKQQARP
ncbi:MAG: tetratricopeptide repeat protein [Gallionella sp.]